MQDRRDDPLDPHKGIYNTLDLGLARAHLRLAAQLYARSRAQCHLSPGRASGWCWRATRSSATSTRFDIPATALDSIPLPERFFGGGGTSHRGFPENQAGPRDTTTGFPLGGTALLFNQTELRFPLSAKISGACSFTIWGTSIPAWTRSLSA